MAEELAEFTPTVEGIVRRKTPLNEVLMDVVYEYGNMREKWGRLADFLKDGPTEDVPDYEIGLMRAQLTAMAEYKEALYSRMRSIVNRLDDDDDSYH